MKAATLAIGMLVVGSFLLAAAPTGAAFGWCTVATHEDCPATACIGTSTDQWGRTTCQYEVPPDVCDLWPCIGPPPVLP